MIRYLAIRLVQMVPAIIGLTFILFVLVRVGGDPVAGLVPPDSTPEEIASIIAAYGFDRPLYVQYFDSLGLILRGDFGNSIRFRTAALPMVLERLPATLWLTSASVVIAILIAFPAALLSVVYRNSIIDLMVTFTSTLGRALPNFWLGIILILTFSLHYRWFPVSGMSSFASIVLPATTLGTSIATTFARILRSSLLETMPKSFITAARAKGLAAKMVLMRHALRNALIPTVTVFGMQVSWLLGGAVIVENVFAWPGIGRLMLASVLLRDLSVVQAGVFVFALVVMGANLLVDIVCVFLDPRIRVG